MGTISVGSVIDQFERKILDEGNEDWTEAENVLLFNNVIRTMILLVPKIHSKTEPQLLAPGVLQFLPANGIELVDIPLNMGSDGQTPGAPLRESTLKIFNDVWPSWAYDPEATVIEHYMKDDNEERRYYVYPPVSRINISMRSTMVCFICFMTMIATTQAIPRDRRSIIKDFKPPCRSKQLSPGSGNPKGV
jgi:hypothetical protein